MATPLPLPKHRFLRIVVSDIYVLVIFSAFYLCWNFLLHRHWNWDWGKFAEWALIIALSSITTNMDYYDWRNRRQSSYSITPDRDEATPSRKPIDNRSQEI